MDKFAPVSELAQTSNICMYESTMYNVQKRQLGVTMKTFFYCANVFNFKELRLKSDTNIL
jgi:hypothetical protein